MLQNDNIKASFGDNYMQSIQGVSYSVYNTNMSHESLMLTGLVNPVQYETIHGGNQNRPDNTGLPFEDTRKYGRTSTL